MSQKNNAIICLSHFEGGMELDALKQAELFSKHNISNLLICKSGSFIETHAKKRNLKFSSIDFKSKLSLALIFKLRKIIKENNIDKLIFFGTSEIKSIYFALIQTSCSVIMRHGTTKSSRKKDLLHKIFYKCVSYHVVISDHLRKNTIDIFPCNEQNVYTIYNPIRKYSIDTTIKKDLGFLFVGRIEEGKGVKDAILAIANSNILKNKKNITFVGKGKDTFIEELKHLASKNNVTVDFTGFTEHPEVYYQRASYFLFPSYGEGLGNVILEALQHNLICITYDNTVFPEFTKLGFKRFYTSIDKDIVDLSRNIDIVCKRPEEINEINLNQEILVRFFSEKHFIEEWKKVIDLPLGRSKLKF